MIKAPFPWQQSLWQHLQNLKSQAKLPHALLFAGGSGLGKQAFADQFGQFLLCQSPKDNAACLTCHACRLVEAKTHPDSIIVRPEKPEGPITILQVRALAQFILKTAQRNGMKWICFENAERLNIPASNALLKLLEEPPKDTVLALVTAFPNRLLPTIISRCQSFRFIPPSDEMGMAWLKEQYPNHPDLLSLWRFANYGPLNAIKFAEAGTALRAQVISDLFSEQVRQSPMHLAQRWIKNQPHALLYYFYRLLADIILMQLGCHTQAWFGEIIDPSWHILQRLPTQNLFGMLDKILEVRQACEGQSGRNLQLMLGSLFIDWQNNWVKYEYRSDQKPS